MSFQNKFPAKILGYYDQKNLQAPPPLKNISLLKIGSLLIDDSQTPPSRQKRLFWDYCIFGFYTFENVEVISENKNISSFKVM